MCQGSFNGISRVFQGSFRFKEASRVCKESFKGISVKKFTGNFRKVLEVFQGGFKGVPIQFLG